MENKDVIELLRHQRHDLMNHMQVIQGYLSMGKKEKVEEKLHQLLDLFNSERKLMNLNAPVLAIWILQFNFINKNIRLTYDIHTENKDLSFIDEQMEKISAYISKSFSESSDESELYEMKLDIADGLNDNLIDLNYSLVGSSIDKVKLEKLAKNNELGVTIDVVESELDDFSCSVSV